MHTSPFHLVNGRDVGDAHPSLLRGAFLRGDAPHPGEEHNYHHAWPPRTVVDLRSPSEYDNTHPLSGMAQIVEAPLVGDVVVENNAPIGLRELYLGFTKSPGSRYLIQAIGAIAKGPAPVLVHCAAGTDRTGVVVAITLRLLGVPHDSIIADYRLSDEAMLDVLGRWQARRRRMNLPDELPDVDQNHLRATARTMSEFLQTLDATSGGAEGWYLNAGGDRETLIALRARLLAAENTTTQ